VVPVLFRIARAIVVVTMLGSLVLAGYVYWRDESRSGFEIFAFILFPLIAGVASSIAISFLILLGVALEGALVLSRGRTLWRFVLAPLAVAPVVALAG
jgi:hypothetical protein